MKFTVRATSGAARCGRMSHMTGRDVDTPSCMVYTRAGCAAHLARDVLHLLTDVPGLAQMPLAHLSIQHQVLSDYKLGARKFSGMERYSVFCSVQDLAQEIHSGYNDKNSVSVWNRGGKHTLTVDSYHSLLEAARPDLYQALCDTDTGSTSTTKRCRKAVDRTLSFLDHTTEFRKESQVMKTGALFGVLVGGHDLTQRRRSAKETAHRAVDGFSLEGFSGGGGDFLKLHPIKPLLKASLAELPSDKPRHLAGLLSPADILHAVDMGVDLFDSSYAYISCERGAALTFDYDLTGPREDVKTDSQQQEICLRDEQFCADLSPLLPGCSCHTCTHHTRAYLCHLLNTSELLASSLLIIHNFHHLFGYFRAIRQSLEDDTWSQLKVKMLGDDRPCIS